MSASGPDIISVTNSCRLMFGARAIAIETITLFEFGRHRERLGRIDDKHDECI